MLHTYSFFQRCNSAISAFIFHAFKLSWLKQSASKALIILLIVVIMGLRQIFLQTDQNTNSDFTVATTMALRGLEGKKMHSEPQAATDDLKLALWFVTELLNKYMNQNKKDILMQLRTDVDLG